MAVAVVKSALATITVSIAVAVVVVIRYRYRHYQGRCSSHGPQSRLHSIKWILSSRFCYIVIVVAIVAVVNFVAVRAAVSPEKRAWESSLRGSVREVSNSTTLVSDSLLRV